MLKSKTTSNEDRLCQDLADLKQAFDWGHALKLKWIQGGHSTLEGEVQNHTLYIYSATLEKARNILRHEFIEALINEANKPYEDLCNLQRCIINQILADKARAAYDARERVVEKIVCGLHTYKFIEESSEER